VHFAVKLRRPPPLVVFVDETQAAPRGYGFAWRTPDLAGAVAMPVPLNVVARALRRLWHWMVYIHGGQSARDSTYLGAWLEADRHYRETITELRAAEKRAYLDGLRDGASFALEREP
jgi:hypothetical protein